MTPIERAKLATHSHSHADFARFLEVSPSAIQGYERRGVLPLEQCIKVAERTGVSLDWLITGKDKAARLAPDAEEASKYLPADEQMLLLGWKNLDKPQKDYLMAVLFQMVRGENGTWPPRDSDVPMPKLNGGED